MPSESTEKSGNSPVAALLAAARRDIEAARRAAGAGPSSGWGRTEPLLHHAAGCLRECGPLLQTTGHGERAPLRETVRGMAAELARLDSLLGQSMSFWTGWTDRLDSMRAGYTAAGSPARPRVAPRIHMEA